MLFIKSIKIFNDNLVWLIYKKNKCIIIDPGLSQPIIQKLEKKKLTPIFIFITHTHFDHIHGIYKLMNYYPNIKIFTPKKIINVCKKKQIIIKKEKNIIIFNKLCKILITPGHTKKDLSYYFYPYLFCGDILFSGGCGNTKNGCSKKLYNSLKKIISLPEETIFFNSHEYTISNLEFSKKISQKEILIHEYLNFLKQNSKMNMNYNYIKFEKKINLFLRTKEKKVQKIINYWYSSEEEIEYFCNLRKIKDQF